VKAAFLDLSELVAKPIPELQSSIGIILLLTSKQTCIRHKELFFWYPLGDNNLKQPSQNAQLLPLFLISQLTPSQKFKMKTTQFPQKATRILL